VIFFTPPRIMLYNNGLGNSQTFRLPPAHGEVSTAMRTLSRRPSAWVKFAVCSTFLRSGKSYRFSRPVG